MLHKNIARIFCLSERKRKLTIFDYKNDDTEMIWKIDVSYKKIITDFFFVCPKISLELHLHSFFRYHPTYLIKNLLVRP